MNAKSKKEFATHRKKILFSELFSRQTNACWATVIWKKVHWSHSLKIGKSEFSLQNTEVLEVESLKNVKGYTALLYAYDKNKFLVSLDQA